MPIDPELRDVMQVCYNGHVITDLLKSCPQHRQDTCSQCGAATLDHCLTCGAELPGAVPVPGLVGTRRPPGHCPRCGAPFPWAGANTPVAEDPLTAFERILRRVPRMVRELRNRQGDRPPFRVEDRRDLEDLMRALLPLWFDNVWPQARTPSYSATTHTDFRVDSEGLMVVVKLVRAAGDDARLTAEWQEDVQYYLTQASCRTLLGFVYDPLARLPDPRRVEAVSSPTNGAFDARLVIAES